MWPALGLVIQKVLLLFYSPSALTYNLRSKFSNGPVHFFLISSKDGGNIVALRNVHTAIHGPVL